jgi:pilus assembly protein CpaC
MKTLRPISRASAIWSAIALIGIAGQPLLGATAHAGQAARPAATVNPDVDHTGMLRIGFNEKLPATRHVLIGLDKSMVVELPRDLKDVVVSNPANLDAVVQTSNRVFLIAKKVGDANVFFFDENGQQVLTLEVRVEHDMQVFNRLVERLIPGSHINAEILNDTMVLSGSVVNPADSAKASDIAARFMVRPSEGSAVAPAKVINLLQVEAKEQVMLKVTIAEVSRELIKRLGLNAAGQAIGSTGIQLGTNNNFSVSNTSGSNSFFSGVLGPSLASCLLPGFGNTVAPGSSAVVNGKLKSVGAVLGGGAANCLGYSVEAFERAGLIKTLAEPTLTAISGETAAFLAGGEFPVPVGATTTNGISSITIQFKPFGVGLSFTPIVQSEGRITLKVATEVSDLSNKGAVSLSGTTIPALTVRRANTTVELPSGGSMILGGLIQDDTRQAIDGVPGLKSLPILGALFRSRDFQKEETELMVIATPYTVNPVGRNKLVLPTDGLDVATDTQATLMGQINKVYGKHERAPEGEYRGNYGFIVE